MVLFNFFSMNKMKKKLSFRNSFSNKKKKQSQTEDLYDFVNPLSTKNIIEQRQSDLKKNKKKSSFLAVKLSQRSFLNNDDVELIAGDIFATAEPLSIQEE